jgi:SAM-dependent methyltransferase
MLQRWHLDVLRHTCKGLVPFQQPLRALKRRVLPYATEDFMDRGLLQDGLRMVAALREGGVDLTGRDVVEVGSGWHPVIPLVFHFAGARKMTMVDQSRLMDARLLDSALRFVARHAGEGAAHGVTLSVSPDADAATGAFEAALARLGLEYRAPFDLRDLPDASCDVLVSRAVLEHIPPGVLVTLVGHMRRVLRPGGCICHVVDNTDHYAHRDGAINYVNFLKYEDWQWRLLTLGPLSYTNRLRHSDYRRLFAGHGFDILLERTNVDARSLESLPGMQLARAFRGQDPQDLATATSLFVARARAEPANAR